MQDLKDHFLRAIKYQPKFSEAHVQLALIYQDEKDDENVISHFNSAISSDLEQLVDFEKKGDELMKKFQFPNAKEFFLKSQEKRIHCSKVYYLQSKYYNKCGKTKLAQAALKESISLNPNYAKAYRNLGIILLSYDEINNARLHIEKSINIDYSDSKSHYYLAKIMIIMKDYSDAEQHLLSALDINPKCVDCLIELALIKLYFKNEGQARKYYQQAKNINPQCQNKKLDHIVI